MELNLIFKDQYVEKEFRNSQLRIHQKSFLILTVALVLQSSGIYFSNPLDLDIFEKKIFLIFFSGMIAVVSGYVVIWKKFPKHSDKGIMLYVFSFTMCAAEFVHIIQDSLNLGSWVYLLLGVNIQTGCLFLLISQVRWTRSILVISTAHIYSWFRVIDIINITGAQKTASISLAIHILLFLTLTYTNEKEIRLGFQKIRENSQQLSSFDEIIKSVLGNAIIIIKGEEVVFFNDATKKILEVQNSSEVFDLLSTIQIVPNSENNSRYSYNIMGDRLETPLNHKTQTLYKYYKNLLNKIKSPKEKSGFGFKNLEGEIQMMEELPKCFSIQLGLTFWKGADSIIIIINDVSSIKNHFKTLDSYKDNLLATVSHDLRTPLNGMLGMLEVLYEETEDPSKKEKLLITITSAKLLLNMINDILDFSLISKGKLRLKFETTNIRALVEETKSIMALQANMKGLKLEVETFLSGDENFLVDSNRLRQFLLNLVGNAIKFTSEGYVTVRIYEEIIKKAIKPLDKNIFLDHDPELKEDIICSSEKNGQNMESSESDKKSLIFSSMNLDKKRIIFEVEDSGIGIKPDEIEKLFKLFSRVTSGHDKNMNGIGLGLAISQSLVILMNSHRPGALISVVSEFGKGSIFRFPIYIDNEPSVTFKEVVENKMNSPLFHETKEQNLSKLNVVSPISIVDSDVDLLIKFKPKKMLTMIVDDDQINLLVAKTYLNSYEHEISFVTAGDGKDALEKVNSFALNNKFFEVFLMDCNMPVLDGYKASQKLKAMMRDNKIPWAPIVAITANIASTDKEKCFESGMDLFLTKPYSKLQLYKILQEAALLKKKS